MITNTYSGKINLGDEIGKEVGFNNKMGWGYGFGMPWNYPFFSPNFMLSNNSNIVPAISHNISEPWPLTFQDKSIQYNLNKLVNVIRESIMDEEKETQMYTKLANMAPTEEQKNIILEIAQNEKTHSEILKKIFQEITGSIWPSNMPKPSNIDGNETNTLNYTEMLKKFFMGELKANEKYRELLAYAPNKQIYSMLFYIFGDELKHANLYNYLITLNNDND